MDDLKRDAEAQMRRQAPELPGAKRQRVEPGLERFQYASIDDLIRGDVPCFLCTTSFNREKSATREALDLLLPRLPEGVKLQPVKVSCRGLVLLLAKGLEPLQAVRIVEALLEGVDKASLQRPKFCQRILPAATTCLHEADAMKAAAQRMCRAYAAGGSHQGASAAAITFAVTHRGRNSEPAATADDAAAKTCDALEGAAAAHASTAAHGDDPKPSGALKEGSTCGGEGDGGQPLAQPAARQYEQQPAQTAEGEQRGLQPPSAGQLGRGAAIEIMAAALQQACSTAGLSSPAVDLKTPQVVLSVEEVPIGGCQLAALALLPAHLCVRRKLAIKALAAGKAAAA